MKRLIIISMFVSLLIASAAVSASDINAIESWVKTHPTQILDVTFNGISMKEYVFTSERVQVRVNDIWVWIGVQKKDGSHVYIADMRYNGLSTADFVAFVSGKLSSAEEALLELDAVNPDQDIALSLVSIEKRAKQGHSDPFLQRKLFYREEETSALVFDFESEQKYKSPEADPFFSDGLQYAIREVSAVIPSN